MARSDVRRLAWLAPMLTAACATSPVDPYARRVVDDFDLRPFAIHEECRHLEADDRFDYRFESSEPLAFDLRYRDGNALIMPIVRAQSREDSGVYPAPFADDFCLSWEAGPAGARLSFRFQVHPAGR